MALTGKQEAFCQAIADGMNQSDAYRHAYDADNMTSKSVTEKASELAANVNIKSRVNELKDALSQKAIWTREQSVNELVDIASLSKGAGQFGAATGAIKELNAMHGYNEAVKVEHSGSIGGLSITVQAVMPTGELVDDLDDDATDTV
jgi:hypothetical protein